MLLYLLMEKIRELEQLIDRLKVEGLRAKGAKLDEAIQQAEVDWGSFDFKGLFEQVLNGIQIVSKLFYCAKLKHYTETSAKSSELIDRQRLLVDHLKRSGINTILAGRVMMHKDEVDGQEKLSFKEKGVDVRMAVDITTMALVIYWIQQL